MIAAFIRNHWKWFFAFSLVVLWMGTGMRNLFYHADKARYEASRGYLEHIAENLETYKLTYGRYPSLASFTEIASQNAPIKLNYPGSMNYRTSDPWDQPLYGYCTPNGFELSCNGCPRRLKEFPPFTIKSCAP